MNVHPHRLHPQWRTGFSIVEMLVVIAILGVLSAVTINAFSQAKRQIVVENVNRRNAQAFSTVAICAQLGGVDPVQGTDVLATLHKLAQGVTATDGPMAGRKFQIPGFGDEDIAGAAYYLYIQNGQLLYDASKPLADR